MNTKIESSTWELLKLANVIEKMQGGGTPSKKVARYWDGNIPWASVKDIVTHNKNDTLDHISEIGLKNSSTRLVPRGTLIVPTRMALGHAVFFNVDVSINQDLKAIYPIKELRKQFLYYWFQSKKKYIARLGSGSTVDGISQDELKNIDFLLPPLPEQEKIVEVLETWDEYLEKLKCAIKIKKKAKKGLMQKLLTRKIRLPGFKENWNTVFLGEIYDITSSKRVFQSEWTSYGIPFYRAREIVKLSKNGFVDNELFISKEMYDLYKLKYGVPKKNDLLVTGVGTIGALYLVKDNVEFYFKDGNIIWFKNKRKASGEFIKQCFRTRAIKKQILGSSPITTVATYTIEAAKKTKIDLPILEEQTAIAKILTTADQEIEAFEKKRALIEAQKKFLLNNLVTGKIRLPEFINAN